jgi:hypothetical protein
MGSTWLFLPLWSLAFAEDHVGKLLPQRGWRTQPLWGSSFSATRFRYPCVPETLSIRNFFATRQCHIAMKRYVAGKPIVNPGSAGQPLDGNYRASYATWEDGKVKLHRVS